MSEAPEQGGEGMTDNLGVRLQKAAADHCKGLDLPHDLGLVLLQQVFVSDGNEEARWIEHEQNSCPYCGGSGHKDDVKAAMIQGLSDLGSDYEIDCATKEEWAQRAFSAEARIKETMSDIDDARLAELLCQARQEGRKSERKAVVNYLRTKGTVISRILGNAIEEGLHCVDK